MQKSEKEKEYKFLDDLIQKNWEKIEIRIMLKEVEERYFKRRNQIN